MSSCIGWMGSVKKDVCVHWNLPHATAVAMLMPIRNRHWTGGNYAEVRGRFCCHRRGWLPCNVSALGIAQLCVCCCVLGLGLGRKAGRLTWPSLNISAVCPDPTEAGWQARVWETHDRPPQQVRERQPRLRGTSEEVVAAAVAWAWNAGPHQFGFLGLGMLLPPAACQLHDGVLPLCGLHACKAFPSRA